MQNYNFYPERSRRTKFKILLILLIIFLGIFCFAKISQADIATGLVGYWKFDEGSGTTASDSSSYDNNGTLVNSPNWTTGKIGGALDFNGSNNYVSMGAVLDMPERTGITLAAWVRIDTFRNFATIIEKLVDNGNYRFQVNGDGTISFGLRNTANTYQEVVTTATLTTGQWYHIIATFDDNTTGKIYINGSLSKTKTDFSIIRGATASALKVGYNGNNNVYFDGTIDEVRIYNRTLSASEVTELYNHSGAGGGDIQSPTTPTSLAAIAVSSSQINLSWTASTDNVGVIGYRIYRVGTLIGTTANTSYSDTGLTSLTTYSYTVAAYDAAGNLSGQSNNASATTQASPPGNTYYVSTSGDDRNSGTSPSSPWAHCPGMSGWSGSATLKSGDTVLFKNNETWAITSFSASTAGVTYDGAIWGTGTRAKFQLTADVGGMAINKSNITFTGIEIDGAHHNFTLIITGSSGNISNIEISNCILHDNWNHQNEGSTWVYPIAVAGWESGNMDTVRIINNTVYNAYHEGIILYTGNISSAGSASNIIVRGNTVYNTGEGSDKTYGAGLLIKNKIYNSTIEFNHFYNNYVGIQFETNGVVNGHPTGIIIRHNLIRNNLYGLLTYNDGNYAFDFEAYSNLFINNGESGGITPYNHGSGGSNFWIATNGIYTGSVFKIYNNTFFIAGNAAGYNFLINLAQDIGSPTLDLRNNIFYSDDVTCIHDMLGGKITTKNYNLYYRTSGASDTVINNGGSTYTRSTVTNWDSNAQNANPNFKNTSNLPIDFSGIYGINMIPNTDGLSISAGSAIDTGINLGTSYNGAVNFSGTNLGLARPQGVAYDIGAYEYVGTYDTTPPAAPSEVVVN